MSSEAKAEETSDREAYAAYLRDQAAAKEAGVPFGIMTRPMTAADATHYRRPCGGEWEPVCWVPPAADEPAIVGVSACGSQYNGVPGRNSSARPA